MEWLSFVLVVVVIFLIYTFFKPRKAFWTEYGVRQVNNGGFLHTLRVFRGKATIADTDEMIYRQLGESGEHYCGVTEMGQNILIVRSIDIVKKILIKSFDNFSDRRAFFPKTEPLFQKMLVSLQGEEWKHVRSAISPAFTTGKIRRMMECFNQVGNEWINHLESLCVASPTGFIDINAQKETVRYTVDMIAAGIFGMHAGTIKNPDSYFSRMCHRLTDINAKAMLKFALAINFPKMMELLGIRLMDAEAIDFYENVLTQGMKARMSGDERRNDFLQLVAEARKGELRAEGSDELNEFEMDAYLSDEGLNKKNCLSDEFTATAQMVGFFFAGFTTTSNYIAMTEYVLAMHQDAQDRVREEVDQLFKDGNDIDYDKLNALTYLDMFLCEVLRKYPPAYRVERKCAKDYHDPETGLRVPKGAMVAVPVYSIHHDSQYYRYPDKFYPEHFTPEEKAKRSPYAFLPFGSGPRNCIGMRLALIEVKSAVAHLVHNFRIEPSPKTPVPLKGETAAFGVQAPNNLELRFSLIRAKQ